VARPVSGAGSDRPSLRVSDALRLAEEHLALGGVPNPELDSELLLRHVLGWDRARLLANPERVLTCEEQAEYLGHV